MAKATETVSASRFNALSDAQLTQVRAAIESIPLTQRKPEEVYAFETIKRVQAERRLSKAAKEGAKLLAELLKP